MWTIGLWLALGAMTPCAASTSLRTTNRDAGRPIAHLGVDDAVGSSRPHDVASPRSKSMVQIFHDMSPHERLLPLRGKAERTARINASLERLESQLNKQHEEHLHRAELLHSLGVPSTTTAEKKHKGDEFAVRTESSFLELHGHSGMQSQEQFGPLAGAAAGAAMSMLFSRTTLCIMCSYILEMADRQIKAIPRWANGGGGNFPGTMDFSPGDNQGYFRTYPGSYIQVGERIGRRKPDDIARVADHAGHMEHTSTTAPAASTSPPGAHRNKHQPKGVVAPIGMIGGGPIGSGRSVTSPIPGYPGSGDPSHLATRKHMIVAPTETEVEAEVESEAESEAEEGADAEAEADVEAGAEEATDKVEPKTGTNSSVFLEADAAFGPGTGLPEQPIPAPLIVEDAVTGSAELTATTIAGASHDQQQAQNAQDAAATVGMSQNGNEVRVRKVRRGRFTHRDVARVDSMSEKGMEFQQMFKDFMDAIDSVCFRDLPSSYTSYCQMPFKNGEALVELYLHDYEDWEICTQVNCCAKGFYDDDFT